MHILITGGRDYTLTALDVAWLDALHAAHPFTEVLTGGAPGPNTSGHAWAMARGIDTAVYPANWTGDGWAAGPIRNRRMLAALLGHRPRVVLAFPGGRGTADCVRQARKAGVPVLRLGDTLPPEEVFDETP